VTGDVMTEWGPLSQCAALLDRATSRVGEGQPLSTTLADVEHVNDTRDDDVEVSTRSTAHPAIMIEENRWEVSMAVFDRIEYVVDAATGAALFPLPKGQWTDTRSDDGSAVCLIRQDRSTKRWFEYQPDSKLCRLRAKARRHGSRSIIAAFCSISSTRRIPGMILNLPQPIGHLPVSAGHPQRSRVWIGQRPGSRCSPLLC
jgi:hypothetical protein